MQDFKMRRIVSALVAMVMCLSLFSGYALAEGETKFEIGLDVYKWNSETMERGDKVDLSTDTLEVDDEIIVMVNYKNLSKLGNGTCTGLYGFAGDIKYNFEYFQPVNTVSEVTDVNSGTVNYQPVFRREIIKTYLPKPSGGTIEDLEQYDLSNSKDKATLDGDATHRISYISIQADSAQMNADTVIKDEQGTLMAFAYKLKKKTPVGTQADIGFFLDSTLFDLEAYNSAECTGTPQLMASTYTGMLDLNMSEFVPINVDITAISGEPVVDTETGIIKNVDESTGKLDSSSYIVVSGRTKDSGATTLPVDANTVANIYKNATADGAAELTKGDKLNSTPVEATLKDGSTNEYEIKIPLHGYDDEDFIVTIITNYSDADKEGTESDGLLLEASKETQPPVIEKANVSKVFGADGKLTNGSSVKIENLKDQTTGIADNTVIKVYDAAEGGNELISATKTTDGNTYLMVSLAALSDEVVYMTATETGKEESARVAVPYLLSKAPSKVVVENNYYDNNDAPNSYIKISSVKTGESDGAVLTTDIKSNTTFNLYSSVNNGSETPGALISTGITPSETIIDGVLTAVLTLDKKAMGEDGTAYWISAVEPNGENGIEYLESEKVFLSPKKAGSTIKDIIDPENPPTDPPLSDEDKQKIQDIKDQGVPKPVIVPEGTEKTSAALDEYGLNSDSKIIVYFEPAVKTDDGTMTNIATIDATWNLDDMATDDGNKLIIDTPDQGHTYKTYDVNATLDENQLKAAGLKVDNSVYQPQAQVRVAPLPQLTLKNGNATAEDLADMDGENNRFTASDVFVYYNYKFADPGITVKNSDDTTQATGTLKKYIKGETAADGVTPNYLTDEQLAAKITIDNTVDWSKKYTICYEYSDPNPDFADINDFTVTAERDVYVIYKLADVSRDGNISEADSNILLRHAVNLEPNFTNNALLDYLFKTKTANADNSADGNVGEGDANVIKRFAVNLQTINQIYAVDEATKTMKFE